MIPRSMAAASATPRISAETAVHTSAAMAEQTSPSAVWPMPRSGNGKWQLTPRSTLSGKPGRSVGGAKPPTAGSLDKWEKTHIGMFDVPQCQEVIKIIEKGDFKNAQL